MIWNGATWSCKCGFVNAIVRTRCRNAACFMPRQAGEVRDSAAADTGEGLDSTGTADDAISAAEVAVIKTLLLAESDAAFIARKLSEAALPIFPVDRCRVCAWPLASSPVEGCVSGNCSQRPAPSIRADYGFAPESAQ